MTNNTEQQAVPVAQEDREAAAKLYEWFPAMSSSRDAGLKTAQFVRDGGADGWNTVQHFARHRPTFANGATIPADMKLWTGGDSAPEDWDGGPVLRFDGETEHSDDITLPQWKHLVPRYKLNIIAYTPARPLILTPDATQTREAELVAALDMLATAAAEYQEAAQSHISDIRYDEDGNLAERDAKLSVVALPIARAVLNARGGA